MSTQRLLRSDRDADLDAASSPRHGAIGSASLTQRHSERVSDEQRSANHRRLDAAWAAGPVQLSRDGHSGLDDGEVQAAAAHGVAGGGGSLPHLDAIQRSFGPHDVSGVSAHVGGAARDASQAMGAHAYATGNQVAFAESPSLFLAAHEAAHVVQQRAGVQLSSSVGQAGDSYEQQADAVAARVVAGESAEDLLGAAEAGGVSEAVQLKEAEPAQAPDSDEKEEVDSFLNQAKNHWDEIGRKQHSGIAGLKTALERPPNPDAAIEFLKILAAIALGAVASGIGEYIAGRVMASVNKLSAMGRNGSIVRVGVGRIGARPPLVKATLPEELAQAAHKEIIKDATAKSLEKVGEAIASRYVGKKGGDVHQTVIEAFVEGQGDAVGAEIMGAKNVIDRVRAGFKAAPGIGLIAAEALAMSTDAAAMSEAPRKLQREKSLEAWVTSLAQQDRGAYGPKAEKPGTDLKTVGGRPLTVGDAVTTPGVLLVRFDVGVDNGLTMRAARMTGLRPEIMNEMSGRPLGELRVPKEYILYYSDRDRMAAKFGRKPMGLPGDTRMVYINVNEAGSIWVDARTTKHGKEFLASYVGLEGQGGTEAVVEMGAKAIVATANEKTVPKGAILPSD